MYLLERNSRDVNRKLNKWGSRLLAFCGEYGLAIGNGRFGIDGKTGEFTCLSGRNPSVVDYVLVEVGLAAESMNVEVLNLVGSDHLAIKLETSLGNIMEKEYKEDREDVKVRKEICGKNWSEQEIDHLNLVLNSTESLETIRRMQQSDIISELDQFIIAKCPTELKKVREDEFYDRDCITFKTKLGKVLEKLRGANEGGETQKCLEEYRIMRKKYKQLIKRKKTEVDMKKKRRIIDSFKEKRTKEFWKSLNDVEKKGKQVKQGLQADSWPTFLEEQGEEAGEILESETDTMKEVACFPVDDMDSLLTKDISDEEIKTVVSKLRGGSAPGIDGIPMGIFKKFLSVFMPIILVLFNRIIGEGVWPNAWKTSLLLPLLKKGNPMSHENYRLIALVPSMSKIFEKVIDNRLTQWLQLKLVLKEEQGGFRQGYGTVDRAFVLKTLIEKYVGGKNKLYVAFIDLEKAFDNVDRVLLKKQLIETGLPLGLVRLIVSMYWCTKGIVRVGKKMSRVFEVRKGVKQGSTLSPKLFSLFINDVVEFLENRQAPTVELGNRKLCVLLFADDAALIAKSPEDLQTLLILLEKYLEEKKLKLNVKKTEVVIFGKGKTSNRNSVKFYFKGSEIKTSDRVKYLGFIFKSNGSWSDHIKDMRTRGKAAMAAIFRSHTLMGIKDLKMHKRIFNTKVLPVINYGEGLWGYDAARQLESLQLQYYKRLLGLHATTHSLVMQGDVGLFSLRLSRKVSMLKLWLQIISLPRERMIRTAYEESLKMNKKGSWPHQIKAILDQAGMSWIWNEGLGPTKMPNDIGSKVRETMEGQEIQEWAGKMERSETLRVYKLAKVRFGEEVYFKFNLPSRFLRSWIQLRANCLPVLGNIWDIKRAGTRDKTSCQFCKVEIGDLDHLLYKCQELSTLRENLFNGMLMPVKDLLKSTNPRTICRIGVFIDHLNKQIKVCEV